MQIRILVGELTHYPREADFPVPNAELHIIDYPMHQDYEGEDPYHPDLIKIANDEELEAWASSHYQKWEIVDFIFSSRALTEPTGLGKQAISSIDNSESEMEVAISLLGAAGDTVTSNLTRAEQDSYYHVLDGVRLAKLSQGAN